MSRPILYRILKFSSRRKGGFPGISVVKNAPGNAGDTGLIPGQEDPLEKEMATHSSVLAGEIPWTKEAGRLQSMELERHGHFTIFFCFKNTLS